MAQVSMKKNARPMFRNIRLFSLAITLLSFPKHLDNSIFFIKITRKISLDSGCEELYLTSPYVYLFIINYSKFATA